MFQNQIIELLNLYNFDNNLYIFAFKPIIIDNTIYLFNIHFQDWFSPFFFNYLNCIFFIIK
jgi:hypothetical protein